MTKHHPHQPKKPNQVVLNYIRKHFAYDPITGTVMKNGKVLRSKTKNYILVHLRVPNPIGDGSTFIHRTNVYHIGWFLTYGSWAEKPIDHKDGDHLNNRLDNLRLATTAENSRNTRKRVGCSSQYKGVCFSKGGHHPRGRPWQASIQLNKKRLAIGMFASEIEAAQAYDVKARELFGEFACLNFPLPGERSAI